MLCLTHYGYMWFCMCLRTWVIVCVILFAVDSFNQLLWSVDESPPSLQMFCFVFLCCYRRATHALFFYSGELEPSTSLLYSFPRQLAGVKVFVPGAAPLSQPAAVTTVCTLCVCWLLLCIAGYCSLLLLWLRRTLRNSLYVAKLKFRTSYTINTPVWAFNELNEWT